MEKKSSPNESLGATTETSGCHLAEPSHFQLTSMPSVPRDTTGRAASLSQEESGSQQPSQQASHISSSLRSAPLQVPEQLSEERPHGTGRGASLPSLDEVSSSQCTTQGMGHQHAATFSSLQSGTRKSVICFAGISFESALQGTQAVSSTSKSPEGSVPAPSTADLAKGGQGQGQNKLRGRKQPCQECEPTLIQPALKYLRSEAGERGPVYGGQDKRSTPGSLMAAEGIHGDPGQAALAAQHVEILKKASNSPKTGAETVLKDDQALRMKVQELEEKLQALPVILQETQARGEEHEEEEEQQQQEEKQK
ncbi:Hypothetical predicted protein [Podarcis lilfordi]|uniref:Uncharacterized protein n=1 Tax=Podarcis lilfordi TaxID=74358 RepID=A0AA35LND5_9SAUR|nr:Hypothetical predicted protein [Podarcis lilfordi]